jgi:hypothetical protein
MLQGYLSRGLLVLGIRRRRARRDAGRACVVAPAPRVLTTRTEPRARGRHRRVERYKPLKGTALGGR